jgi:hypothetical protein
MKNKVREHYLKLVGFQNPNFLPYCSGKREYENISIINNLSD